jgi:hypothetical protein
MAGEQRRIGVNRELAMRTGIVAGLVGGIVIWIYEALVGSARRT